MMNTYNLAEVYVQLAERLSEEQLDDIVRAAQALPIRHISISDQLVFRAARLRASYELSAPGAVALATALQEEASLVTREPLACTIEGVSICPLRSSRVAPVTRQVVISLT